MAPSVARVVAAYTKTSRLKKVRNIWSFGALARKDPQYMLLLKIAAENLGFGGKPGNYQNWMYWLELSMQNDDEDGIMAEVNFVKDIAEDMIRKNSPEYQAVVESMS
jgi:hypothetical protein